jgi:hypothetical protein
MLVPYDETQFVDASDPEESGWENVPENEPGNSTNFSQIDLEDGILAFFSGSAETGAEVDIPSIGFSPANLLFWASPKGTSRRATA